MSGDQWFRLWLALGQVAVTGIVSVSAVFVAARLAFRQSRERASEDRSRQGAEKVAFALEESWRRLVEFAGMITFVLQPSPATLSDALARDVDPAKYAAEAHTPFGPVASEAALLTRGDLRRGVSWASACLIDFSLVAQAVGYNHDRYTMAELAETASNAAEFIREVIQALHQYLRNEDIADLRKPTYWRSPVGEEPEAPPSKETGQ